MSASNVQTYVSWAEVYQMIRARAEAARGVQSEQADGVPDAVPNTTVADGYRVALVFDKSIYDHTPDSLVSRWTAVSERLVAEPENAPGPYAGNRALWSTLANAALELDRAQAPLPSAALVNDAIDELAGHDPACACAAGEAEDGASSARLVTVFEEDTWRGMALRQLSFFRALRGEMKTTSALMPAVPATSNAEVLALGRYWQQQVALSAGGEQLSSHQTYHRLVYSWWYAALHQLSKRAKDAPPGDLYSHNSEFWIALLLLTTQSDHASDIPFPWAFHVATDGPHRNAAPSGSMKINDALIDFQAVKTWDDAARVQRDTLAQLRGFDTVANALVSRVPRTTISDVRQLATFWTLGLIRVGVHRDEDISYKHIIDRWHAEVEHLRAISEGTPANTVYARNTEFWGALMTVAAQVGVTDETPTHWQMIKDSVVQAVKDVPSGNWIGKLGEFGRLITATAGEWLTSKLARPLLYAGGGLLTLTALWYFLPRRAAKSVAERVS